MIAVQSFIGFGQRLLRQGRETLLFLQLFTSLVDVPRNEKVLTESWTFVILTSAFSWRCYSYLLPIFDRKGTPLVNLVLMVPLHIPSLVLIACLSSAINLLCTVF